MKTLISFVMVVDLSRYLGKHESNVINEKTTTEDFLTMIAFVQNACREASRTTHANASVRSIRSSL